MVLNIQGHDVMISPFFSGRSIINAPSGVKVAPELRAQFRLEGLSSDSMVSTPESEFKYI
jgi:hypothetical protein